MIVKEGGDEAELVEPRLLRVGDGDAGHAALHCGGSAEEAQFAAERPPHDAHDEAALASAAGRGHTAELVWRRNLQWR